MAFGEWRINLANFTIHIGQISSAQNVGEIDQAKFLPKALCLWLFAWGTKVGEIDPSCSRSYKTFFFANEEFFRFFPGKLSCLLHIGKN